MFKRRFDGSLVLAVVFALFALNAWAQVALVAVGRSDDPPALTGFQALVGAAGAAAAWGSWIRARWAPSAAIAYGVATAAMLVLLAPLLDLGAEARGGLWIGASAVLVFALSSAWYLRRLVSRIRN